MSRGSLEARAAWQAWYTIYTNEGNAPTGFKHDPGCSAFNSLDEQGFPDMIVCSGCRSEIKRPETECTPVYDLAPAAKPSKIRVLRILEYTFDNAHIAAHHMSRWTLSISPATIMHPNALTRDGMSMRSVAYPIETIEWDTPS